MTLLLALSACDTTQTDPAETSDAPTYYEDVAPILADNCVSCHQAGEVGPFVLVDYETVSMVGQAVADSVVERRMPPFLADNSGSCATYEHAAWLEQDEIDLVQAWVDGGMLEGDPANAPELPSPEAGLEDRTTHSLTMDSEYLADFEDGDDDYRCFIIDPGLTEDGFITAFEIEAGDPEIVHHVIVYHPSDDGDLADAYSLDDSESGDGYTCFGGPRVSASMVAAWAPGRTIWEYPDGTGIAVEAGMPLIVQMHYNNGGISNKDASKVNLEIKPQVDRELTSWFYVNSDIAIPPGEESHEESQMMKLSNYAGFDPGPIEVLGVGPHMHSIGQSLFAEVRYAGSDDTACLVDMPRWDFNWQFAYMFEEPVPMDGDDRLFMSCSFDSSDRDETTYWGDGTSDEMCLVTMYTVSAE
jgi:hypothetical protein